MTELGWAVLGLLILVAAALVGKSLLFRWIDRQPLESKDGGMIVSPQQAVAKRSVVPQMMKQAMMTGLSVTEQIAAAQRARDKREIDQYFDQKAEQWVLQNRDKVRRMLGL